MATPSRRALQTVRASPYSSFFLRPCSPSQRSAGPLFNRSRVLGNPCLGSGVSGIAQFISCSGVKSRFFSSGSVDLAYMTRLLRPSSGFPGAKNGAARLFSSDGAKKVFYSTRSAAAKPSAGSHRVKPSPLGTGIKGLGNVQSNSIKNRLFSIMGQGGRNATKLGKMAKKPVEAVKSTVVRYKDAAGLQLEAFWKRNYLIFVGGAAVVICILLWRVMFGIANTFIGLSEGMAKYGFLALASAMVAFAGLYLRSRFTINPDSVYRLAMRELNTSAPVLEVMGAPLAGTDLRAYVMSGAGPKLKDFKLKFGRKRCFLIFPIRGSERRGLVSVEAKKKKGKYDLKLLAVDIPMASGSDQRIFLAGDEQEYRIGGGLIAELRDPIVKAMAAEKEFAALDEQEEEEEEQREREEAERRQQEEEAVALRDEEERARRRLEQERIQNAEKEQKRQESENQKAGSTA